MSDLPAPATADNSEYIAALEARVAQLEGELQQLKGQFAKLPNTKILSQDFLARAFTIWGHNIIASLILLAPCLCWQFFLSLIPAR